MIQTFQEYGRGIAGGLIFSLPLLYTMEVWWTGFIADPLKLLAFIAFTFLLLIGYNMFSGMREDANLKQILHESVEELGLAFLVTFLFLLLINKVGFTMSFREIAGKVIVESLLVSIGISVGTAQLGQEEEDQQGMKGQKKKGKSLLHVLTLSLCGAVLISSSVAPTDEILILAIVSSDLHLLLMVVFSLILATGILYYIDFKGTGPAEGGWREIALHVLTAYVAALLTSFILLWFFGRIQGNNFEIILAQMIVLSIPATLGASAGRLLL